MEQSNNQGKIFAQQWSQKPLSDSLQFNGSSLFNFTVTTHINSINLANGFLPFNFFYNFLSISLDSHTRKSPLWSNPTIREKYLHPRWYKRDKKLLSHSTY